MSREANFMQSWQQRLVDERGGVDGQNYSDLVRASHEAYEGMNPKIRGYSEVRTVRAVVLGAVGFESFCQDALIEQALEPTPVTAVSYTAPYELLSLPKPFEDLVTGYFAAFKTRRNQDSLHPSLQSAGFRFYECANVEFNDAYWEARLASDDLGPASREHLEELREQTKDFNNVMLDGFSNNVSTALDVLVAFGASLCIAKQRPCRAEELGEYAIDNIEAATALTSATREQLTGVGAALPATYRSVLQGDTETAGQRYVTAIEDKDKACGYRAQWCHPSLRNGKWKHPGYCPASDYNSLRPRTDEEATAAEASLGLVGLSGLIADGSVTAGQLVIAKTLRVARETIFQETEWQERVIAA